MIETLKTSLPTWVFQPYGNHGAIACYPAGGVSAEAFGELSRIAPITSVCGPFYVVTRLRAIIPQGPDSVEEVFRDVALMTPAPPKDENPYQSEEYQRFVASMVPHCRCRESNRPCDGVLAGGLCDNLQDEPDWTEGHDCPAGDIREDESGGALVDVLFWSWLAVFFFIGGRIMVRILFNV